MLINEALFLIKAVEKEDRVRMGGGAGGGGSRSAEAGGMQHNDCKYLEKKAVIERLSAARFYTEVVCVCVCV